jgi:hypothetical protein
MIDELKSHFRAISRAYQPRRMVQGEYLDRLLIDQHSHTSTTHPYCSTMHHRLVLRLYRAGVV